MANADFDTEDEWSHDRLATFMNNMRLVGEAIGTSRTYNQMLDFFDAIAADYIARYPELAEMEDDQVLRLLAYQHRMIIKIRDKTMAGILAGIPEGMWSDFGMHGSMKH